MWWAVTVRIEYERAKKMVDKKEGRPEGYNICVSKSIAAPLAKVYAAWTNEAVFRKWFGDKLKAKVTEGGKFLDAAGNSGEFQRVRDNKDLRFTWNHPEAAAPTLVDVTFADKGKGKTLVTLMHNRIQNRAEADGLRAAWSAAFERLKKQLEAG